MDDKLKEPTLDEVTILLKRDDMLLKLQLSLLQEFDELLLENEGELQDELFDGELSKIAHCQILDSILEAQY